MISTWDKEWGDQHWGATPEAMDASEALIGEGSEMAASQAKESGKPKLAQQLRQWAPVVGAYVKQFQDPTRQMFVLEAKLKTAKASGAPKYKIRILEARLAAARRNAGWQESSRQEAAAVKSSAVTVTRVFTGVGIALIILILSRAIRR